MEPWQVFSAGRGGSGGTGLATALMLNCVVLDFPLDSNAIDAGLKSDPEGKCQILFFQSALVLTEISRV